jgi:hypothetical protein
VTTTKGGVLHGPPKLLKTGCLEPHLATHLSGGEDSCLSEFRASGRIYWFLPGISKTAGKRRQL